MNIQRKNDLMYLVLGLVVFGIVYGLMEGGMIGSFWKLNIIIICINIIMSASLNLINGYTGQFSLGHAGFMAVGCYVSVILTTNFHMPLIVGMLAGGAGAALLGCLIGLPTLRLNGDYLAIATLGLGEIIRIVIMNINYVGGAAGFTGIPHLTTFPWVFFTMLVRYAALLKLFNNRTGQYIGVVCEEFFQFGPTLGQRAVWLVCREHSLYQLRAPGSAVGFVAVARLAEDFNHMVARLAGESVVAFKVSVEKCDLAGCFALGVPGKYLADVLEGLLHFHYLPNKAVALRLGCRKLHAQ